jgi:hypothetical protein
MVWVFWMLPMLLTAETPTEVWSGVEVRQLRFVRAGLEDVVQELNRMVQESVKANVYPQAWLDQREPPPLALPEGLTEEEQKRVTEWRDDFMATRVSAWPPPPITLELRSVTAMQALQVVADISGLGLQEEKEGFRISRQKTAWVVMRIPTPSMLKPLADEILADHLDENLWAFFDRAGDPFGEPSCLLKPLNADHLLFIGDRAEGRRLQEFAAKYPVTGEVGPEDLDFGRFTHKQIREFPIPNPTQAILRAVAFVNWGQEWHAYEKRVQEAKENHTAADNDAADPFGFGPDVTPDVFAPGLHIQRVYDELYIEMTASDRFSILYSCREVPGKYFSEWKGLEKIGAGFSDGDITDLVRAFVERDRETVMRLLESEKAGKTFEDPFAGPAQPKF